MSVHLLGPTTWLALAAAAGAAHAGDGGQGPLDGRLARREAAPAAVVAAVARGLAWLADQQQDDGSWAPAADLPEAALERARLVTTSVALLALLGDGNTLRTRAPVAAQAGAPDLGACVKRATAWLRGRQREDGWFLPPPGVGATTAQAAASAALTEACVLSRYRILARNAAAGLQALAARRTPDGGWRAAAGAAVDEPSLTLWCTLAHLSARGTSFDTWSAEPIASWLRGPAARRVPELGPLGLPPPAQRQAILREEQVAANALTHHLVGATDAAALQAALERLRRAPRRWTAADAGSLYEWFCSAHALWQAGDSGAVAAIGRALREAQVSDGDDAGSWPPYGVWGSTGGRAWTTAMAVLTLEAPYRYAADVGR